jgi:methanogenic corrinoid protein MtbC1
VARIVGDDWSADNCSWVDVTLAMSCLQTVIRAESRTSRPPARMAERLSVLVATAPAETHLIGAAMVADRFRESGWDVQIAFPRTAGELVETVKANWLSAVTLSLSDVFARDERLDALKATIAVVRAASRNPAVAVGVGGRAFVREPGLTAERVGADTAFQGADEAVQNMRMALVARAQIKGDDAANDAH